MPTYTVTMHFRFPAWDEKNGIDFVDISATNKAKAIQRARREAADAGHTVGLKITDYWFTAAQQPDNQL